MKTLVSGSKEDAARAAAEFICEVARAVIADKGRFFLAVSGGSTPELMFEALAQQPILWRAVELFQVDERIAPAGDPSRNAKQLRHALLDQVPLPSQNLHLMPVESDDLPTAASAYEAELTRVLGAEPTFDLIHLGLGSDGHTASLVPGDPLGASEGEVGISQEYQGRRRMSLLRAPLNRARKRVWLVTGKDKRNALSQLLRGDSSIVAGTLSQKCATVFADQAAATGISGQ